MKYKHFILKLLLVVLTEVGFLLVINTLSIQFGYLPHTVAVYVAVGSAIAVLTVMAYDRLIQKKPTEQELQIRTIRRIMTDLYIVDEQEFNKRKEEERKRLKN